MMSKIGKFSEEAKIGDKIAIGTNMSKIDELVACELAQQLGLDHEVEGTYGINRRVFVSKVSEVAPSSTKGREEIEKNPPLAKTKSAFAALGVDNDSDSDSSNDTGPNVVTNNNNLLADLARERMERQRKQQQHTEQNLSKSGKKVKGKKKKNKKPSQTSTASEIFLEVNNVDDDIDDDMAFLNSQIEKVQTSHGRKVEGNGKAYRSIINGVLIAKPEARGPKKNEQASKALKDKLKKAGVDRKVKSKGTKK